VLEVESRLRTMVQPLEEVAPGEETLVEASEEFRVGAVVLGRRLRFAERIIRIAARIGELRIVSYGEEDGKRSGELGVSFFAGAAELGNSSSSEPISNKSSSFTPAAPFAVPLRSGPLLDISTSLSSS